MKKLLLILLCVPLIYSCGSNENNHTNNTENKEKTEEEKRIDMFHSTGLLKMDVSCGDDTKLEMLITTDDGIKKNLTYVQLQELVNDINFYTNYKCNNKRTYKPTMIICTSNKENSDVMDISMRYICSNSYGVEGDLSSYFTIDYSIFKKEINGDTTVSAYEYIVEEKTYDF